MWIIPPLLPGASRADREWHRREVAATERELKDVWTNVCLVTHLAQVMPPPGAMLQSPRVGSITLDSVPARFTVKLRPGQLPGDFERRAERFAAAFRVPAVEITTLTYDSQWISIRLLEPFWIEWPDEYVLDPALDEAQRSRVGDTADDDLLPAGDRDHPNQVGRGSGPSREPAPATGFGGALRYLRDFWRLPAAP